MKSIWEMLQELEDVRESGELNDWESGFVAGNFRNVKQAGGSTSGLSEKQVDKIQSLWERHCG